MVAETIGRLDVYVPWPDDGPPNWKKAHFFDKENIMSAVAVPERKHIIDYIEYRANRTKTHEAKVALLVLASDLRAELHLPEGSSDGQDKVE